MKYCVFFESGLEFFNEKIGEATEGRGSIVKCGETLFDGEGGWGACENLVELSMCDSPIETFEHIWLIFSGCLIPFCPFCQKTVEIHFLCIQLIN